MADPFTVAYVSATGVLVGAELLAVSQNRGGTITTKVKRSRILHSCMTSLLTWALVHFTLEPKGVVPNVAVAATGAALARPFWKR